jgi:hypothetical protein
MEHLREHPRTLYIHSVILLAMRFMNRSKYAADHKPALMRWPVVPPAAQERGGTAEA